MQGTATPSRSVDPKPIPRIVGRKPIGTPDDVCAGGTGDRFPDEPQWWIEAVGMASLNDLRQGLNGSTLKAVAFGILASSHTLVAGVNPDCELPHVDVRISRVAVCAEVTFPLARKAVITLRQLGFLGVAPHCGSEHLAIPRPSRRTYPSGHRAMLKASALLDQRAHERSSAKALHDLFALYRWYDEDDVLLYVGITDSLGRRQSSHARKSAWSYFAVRSTVERFPTKDAAEEAEILAIERECPLFNAEHNASIEAKRRLVEYLMAKGRTDLLVPISRG